MNKKLASKYRPNVGIIIINQEGKLWQGKKPNFNHWLFPQGGIEEGETPIQTLYRELYEETGILKDQVKIIAESKKWYTYKFPTSDNNQKFIGQKQRWFLIQLKDNNIKFNLSISNEFDNYRWVSYWYPIRNVAYFREDVYRKVLKEFSKYIFNKKLNFL